MRKAIASFLLFITLTSCANLDSTLKTSPTIVMETALAEARTSIVETATLIPSITTTSKPLPSLTPMPPTLTSTESQVESKNEIVQSTGEIVLLDYAFSPSGDKLALFDNSGIYIYDLTSTQKTSFLEFDNSNYTTILSGAVAFSPDGKKLAISGKFDEAEITIWDIESQKPVTAIQGLPKNHFITEIEFSPNGNSILIRNTNTEVEICQGYISDKVILRSIGENKNLFEMDKCKVYPPLYFRFTDNERIFLYSGSMSAEHTVYFIEDNTGKITSQSVHYWTDKGYHFYDVSPDGNINLVEKNYTTYLLDLKSNDILKSIKSNNILNSIEGKVVLIYAENSFVVSGYNPNAQWSFWEDGNFKCAYNGIKLSPEIKTSTNREMFAVKESDIELQIWKVSTCEMVSKFQFDNKPGNKKRPTKCALGAGDSAPFSSISRSATSSFFCSQILPTPAHIKSKAVLKDKLSEPLFVVRNFTQSQSQLSPWQSYSI